MTSSRSDRFATVRAMNVRFSEALHAAMKREAEREGVRLAQFIREAVVARIAWLEAQRAGVEPVDERPDDKPGSNEPPSASR